MMSEFKTVHSFWIPVRILEDLDRESKRKKMSRNRLAITLIEAGLKEEQGGKEEQE